MLLRIYSASDGMMRLTPLILLEFLAGSSN